jgi:hypothetical protein
MAMSVTSPGEYATPRKYWYVSNSSLDSNISLNQNPETNCEIMQAPYSMSRSNGTTTPIEENKE